MALNACMKYSQKKLESVTDEDLNLVECPDCGRDDFESNKGVALHHGKVHDSSISMLYRCEDCGQIKSGNEKSQRFCDDCYWNDKDEEYICPHEECNEKFTSRNGRSVHHYHAHGESIAGYVYECEYCGNQFDSNIAPDSPDAPKYCPVKELDEDEKSCEAKDRTGQSREFTDEWKENISKGMKKAIEEGRTESPFASNSKEWFIENVIEKRDDSYLHESPSQETRKKLSETFKKLYASGEREPASPQTINVEETGHTVDSSWEKEIDLLLHGSDFDYKYNTDEDFVKFDVDDSTYTPDFLVGNCVIEVKGYLGYNYNKDRVDERAKRLKEHDEWEYIVVGSVELECDEYIEWGNRDKLLDVLDEKVDSSTSRSLFDY